MVRLKALGQSEIEVGDARIGPEQPYLFAIALYLIVERGKRVPRQALVDIIWPNVKDEKHARQRFRQALLRLRELGLPVAGGNGTLLLDRNAVQVDFDALASPDAIRPGQSLEFLPHYSPRISERFLDWVDTQRSRVHAGVQRVFLLRMQQARSRGDWAEVDAVATECLRLDPYNEEAVMAHAECAVMRGSKREALSILDNYMEALGSHVGTIGLPAKILRTRIAERLTDQRYAMISEQHFVGRESSMELLQGLLREAQRGAGSAAFIWGEPGIGKSRLVQELVQVASLEDAQVVSTKCHPTDAGRPLSAFADLVPVLKTLPGALGCSAQTLSLLQRLTDRNKSDTLPAQEAGDAAFLAATIRRAVFDLVDAVADEGLLVMVIEDVHWLDEQSWAIGSTMVEWSTTRTILILMTSRTPHATEAKVADPDRGFSRHHLLPLADSDSGSLLDKLTAGDANPPTDAVRSWSVESAEGNPFYLRELVRHWIETQRSFGVPRSLAELIEARLSRLTSLGLRVLQLCAAFGKHSSFERLERATGYQNHVLLDAIEELSSAVMLADKLGIAVKHDLLAGAALNRLGGLALKLVHRQVATVLEAEINEKHTAALMWDCAEHWQRAGDTAHALTTVRLCAHHLHTVGHVHQAVELYERALHICPTAEERIDTLLTLATALKSAASWTRLRELLAEADVNPRDFPNAAIHDRLYLLKLETNWRLQRRSRTGVAEFVSFAHDESKDVADRLQAVRLGLVLSAEAGGEEDARLLFHTLDDLQLDAGHAEKVEHVRMIFHTDFGDMDQALQHADTLLTLESSRAETGSSIRTRLNVAACYRRGGRADEAKFLARDTFDFAANHGLGAHAAWAAMLLANVALQEEDFVGASAWHTRAVTRAIDDQSCRDSLEYIRARIALHDGDLQPVQAFLDDFSDAYTTGTILQRQCYASLCSELALARNEPMDRTQVDLRANDFQKTCGTGVYDFFALSTYRALVAVGEGARAKDLLAEYIISRRRDRGPLLPSLRTLVAELRIQPRPLARRDEKGLPMPPEPTTRGAAR